jgi:pimeloyl-ACP methyl ester carboxylesterase/acyl-CoA thioesterase FadM
VVTDTAVELTVYPDDCDAFGHLNQASFLSLFERARWDALAQGPGADAFTRQGVWPAVRRTTIEYRQQVFPGERLRFSMDLIHHGQTSFAVRQVARKAKSEAVAAEAEFLFVCIGRDGRPVPVPADISRFFGVRPSRRTGATQQFAVRELTLTADVGGDGPAVLFVHGFPLDRTLWRPLAAGLTGWRRIAPDLRGMGQSEGPDGAYQLAAYADDLAALLDALHVERAVVCGLSMGGYVVFELLRRHPARISALILMSTRATPDDADGRARRDAMIARVRRDGPAFLADEMTPRLLAPMSLQTMPEVVQQVRAMASGSPPHGIVGALGAMRDRPDSSALLPTITVPALVLAGHDDQLIPASAARAIADAIPGAHHAIIPAAGHLPPLEQPVNTGRVVREFLEALP